MTMVMERRGVEAKEAKTVKRFEIWLANLGHRERSIQSGVRPVLIVSNDIGNKYSPVVLAIPITSKVKKSMPTHVLLEADKCDIADNSILLCEQIMTLNKNENLVNKLFTLPEEYSPAISRAIDISLGK
ncbi:type II toxin-antitoxin system PemK/MazF family toxin [Paenibacillus sp. QZ-Y1]|uniref:type II toxin-antitoxin system PemK/MazF family toxin n=1 Tax=Paenibacillus sp. QZ-Y1 TaxID=3414511 RepID=UPI003F79441B